MARAMRLPFATVRAADGVEELIKVHRRKHRRTNPSLIRHAYRVADQAHSGQMRKSGEPYITHPLAVATILAQLGLDATTLTAALLHDTVEDTTYTLEQLRNDFGDEVAHLVDGVTKLEKVHFGGIAEAETTRKMILAAARDVRVLLIKLADRLHNMRTLGHKKRASQVRIATVTRDILVPLAGRLGVQVIKRELEDLVLAALDPEAHASIDAMANERESQRRQYVGAVMRQVSQELRDERLTVRVIDRPRHYTSIYERQRAAGMPNYLCDNPRVVIVVQGDNADCYAALGVIHTKWRPVPGRFKDFIAVPKYNLYKSLHTTVFGPDRKPVDVLIRTEEMHEIAEYGIAARHHNRSAHHAGGECDGCWAGESAELDWLQRLLEWQHEAESGAFLESLRYDLSDHEILVFTLDGEAISLPSDATPVDFAYALDTQLGDRCIGVRVNGNLMALSAPLADGDVVEILSSPSAYTGPEREWLETARSPRAQLQIRRWFSDEEKTADVSDAELKAGKSSIEAALARRGRLLLYDRPLIAVARVFGFTNVDELYAGISEGSIDADDVVARLINMIDAR
ncbi:MAG: bifunctional (p)ppGpp synthetase/guanosine-3',5'-bis(diphosphate) 3'-pyrophosphohydrolase [Corynebacteriales bacterium]|nr:bifunctional (p)ppGpp synthetase/guanosine-3',5'-bis(diphosphate) 3'-pyrophosphohydrolase [Mycobacteriales bacterium]